jgi:hypothetical protein
MHFGLCNPLSHRLQLASCLCFGVKQVFPLMCYLSFHAIGPSPFCIGTPFRGCLLFA